MVAVVARGGPAGRQDRRHVAGLPFSSTGILRGASHPAVRGLCRRPAAGGHRGLGVAFRKILARDPWNEVGRLILLSLTIKEVAAVTIVGDVATAAVLVVAGLGLLRAFAPVLILRRQLTEVDIGLVWVCVVIGLILICLPWLIMICGDCARPSAAPDGVLRSRPDRQMADGSWTVHLLWPRHVPGARRRCWDWRRLTSWASGP